MSESRLIKSGCLVDWVVSDRPVAYEFAMSAMTERAAAIRDGRARELVWLLEHPALYTAGTSASDEELLDSTTLPVHRTTRGGRFTYHGPGQRIAYLMLDLRHRGQDVRAVVAAIESWIIDCLAMFNVKGERRCDRIGVWITRPSSREPGEDKIAALGLRVSRSVTTHGLSINVDPDLSHYAGIVPCGISQYGVTSLAALGHPLTMYDVDVALRITFERLFGPVQIINAERALGLRPEPSTY